MEEYLSKGIKEVITEFPEVETILSDYDIGCGPCNVGLCLLKDIVDIHRLPEDQEQELMGRIAKAIDPDKEIKIPASQKKSETKPRGFKYSPPLRELVDEHVLIKRWLALIPAVVKQLDVQSDEGRQLILKGIDLIRSYADKFHHAKEEDILFKYFDEESDILKVMHADHKQGRSYVQAMLQALDRKDKDALGEQLMAYRELLTDHIRKEDEILYPWMDSNLTTQQVGELFSKFNQVDKKIGFSPATYEAFVTMLEEKFQK
jgi:hemerythrin-like domain-containing protein